MPKRVLPAHEVTNFGLRDRTQYKQGGSRIQPALSPYVGEASIQCRVIYSEEHEAGGDELT